MRQIETTMEILVTKNVITGRWREYFNGLFDGEMNKGEQTAILQPAEPFVEEPRGDQNIQQQ